MGASLNERLPIPFLVYRRAAGDGRARKSITLAIINRASTREAESVANTDVALLRVEE